MSRANCSDGRGRLNFLENEPLTMTKYADLAVRGNLDNIRNLTQQAFVANGFEMKWENQMKGRAEKGSKGANIMLGALATHYVVDFEIFQSTDGGTLRLIKTGSGASGGLLGMRSANKKFDQLSETLASWFTQQGILIGVRKQ